MAVSKTQLLTKARVDKRNPLFELLEWRNTSTEGINTSTTQLLYGRRTRNRLPIAETLLEPHVIADVPEKIEMKKQRQKHYYDRHSQELPKLRGGDAIRMRLPGEKEWSLGHVLEEKGNRSYLVEVNGKHYRRNRTWLRTTTEELEPSETSELTVFKEPAEASSVDLPQPSVPSTPLVPEPYTASRPTRERRPPLWLQDYKC